MRKARFVSLMAAAAGLWLGCSDSTAPAPNFIGTWHVKVSSFSVDSLEPNPFTITLSGGNGDTLQVLMSAIQWDHGPNYVFDSVYTNLIPHGANVIFLEKDEADQYLLGLQGDANAARDTITGQIGVLDQTFHSLGSGTFVATKH